MVSVKASVSLRVSSVLALSALLVACGSNPPPPEPAPKPVPKPVVPTKYPVIKAVYGQKIMFSVPLSMTPSYENLEMDRYALEYIPSHQLAHEWTDMVSMAVFPGAVTTMTAEQAMISVGQHLEASCPGDFSYADLGPIEVSGRPAHQGLIGCGRLHRGVAKDKGEISYILTIAGPQDMIILQKVNRGYRYSPQTPPLNQLNYTTFAKDLFPVKLCSPYGTSAECLD